MQANVPQPTHDEDETDDVDEELKKLQVNESTALIYIYYIYDPKIFRKYFT